MRTHNCGSSFENHCNTHICSNGDTIVGTIKRGSFFANLFRHPHNHNCSAPYPLGEKHTTTKIKVVEILIVILPTSSGTHTTIIALRLTLSVEALVVHRRRKAALGCCLRAFPVVTPVLPQLFAFCIGQRLSCALQWRIGRGVGM